MEDAFAEDHRKPNEVLAAYLDATLELVETGRLVYAIGPLLLRTRSSRWKASQVRAWRGLEKRCHAAMRERNRLAHANFDYATHYRDESLLRVLETDGTVEFSSEALLGTSVRFGTLGSDLVKFSLVPVRQRFPYPDDGAAKS